MDTPNRIDYSKFKVEVYTPDGQYIKDVPLNNISIFYCDGLTPGQEYTVIFLYDNILILCLSFNCNDTGKVVYLNPQHLLFNNEISFLNFKDNSNLAEKLRGLGLLNDTYQLWERMLKENAMLLKNIPKEIKIPAKKVVKFKAGNELATKVK